MCLCKASNLTEYKEFGALMKVLREQELLTWVLFSDLRLIMGRLANFTMVID